MQFGHEHGSVAGQDRQQVDHTIKASGIRQRPLDARQTRNVFNGEQASKGPFNRGQRCAKTQAHRLDAVQHDHCHTKQDGRDQGKVKPAPCPRVGLENDNKHTTTPTRFVPLETVNQRRRCLRRVPGYCHQLSEPPGS